MRGWIMRCLNIFSTSFVVRQLNDNAKYPHPKRANLYTLPQTSNTGGLFLSEDTSGSLDPEDCLQVDLLAQHFLQF